MHEQDRTHLEMYRNEFDNEFGTESSDFASDEEDDFENDFYIDTRSDFENDFESPFDETEEMDLAAELLSVSDEQELDQFFGNVFKKLGKVAKRIAKSSVGRQLGGLLRPLAKQALPIVAGAAGGYFGGPAGAAFSRKVGNKAGQLLGLELEGLSNEDQDFEVARQFVRFAGAAAQNADWNAPSGMEREVARRAVVKAAQRHAPGLVPHVAVRDHRTKPAPKSGRWVRQGERIILLGL